MRILAIGAHPDDIEISLFGTLDTARRGGAELVLAIATDGSRVGRKDPVRLREIRRGEAIAAACFLDTEPRFLDYGDAPAEGLHAAMRSVRNVDPDVQLKPVARG